MVAKKVQALSQVVPEALQLTLGSEQVSTQLLGCENDMASFAYRQIAQERDYVGRDVDQQNTAKTDMVVHKANDRTGDEPSALHPGQQKCVRVDEPVLRGQFLNQGSDRRPKHP